MLLKEKNKLSTLFSIQYKENIYEYQTNPSYHIHEGIYTSIHSRRHYAMQFLNIFFIGIFKHL